MRTTMTLKTIFFPHFSSSSRCFPVFGGFDIIHSTTQFDLTPHQSNTTNRFIFSPLIHTKIMFVIWLCYIKVVVIKKRKTRNVPPPNYNLVSAGTPFRLVYFCAYSFYLSYIFAPVFLLFDSFFRPFRFSFNKVFMLLPLKKPTKRNRCTRITTIHWWCVPLVIFSMFLGFSFSFGFGRFGVN